MANVGYDFSTAKFDVSERGVIGSTSLGPIVKLKIGIGLVRTIYEYRNAGLIAGALSSSPQWPNTNLAAINASTRLTLAPGVTQISLAADTGAPSTLDNLANNLDHQECIFVVIDATYASGDRTVACPEIKTWCEALGGTYTTEIP